MVTNYLKIEKLIEIIYLRLGSPQNHIYEDNFITCHNQFKNLQFKMLGNQRNSSSFVEPDVGNVQALTNAEEIEQTLGRSKLFHRNPFFQMIFMNLY